MLAAVSRRGPPGTCAAKTSYGTSAVGNSRCLLPTQGAADRGFPWMKGGIRPNVYEVIAASGRLVPMTDDPPFVIALRRPIP